MKLLNRIPSTVQLAMMALPALSLLNAQATAESKPAKSADLLTVKEPKSEAESRLRVIRLTTRDGSTGYGVTGLRSSCRRCGGSSGSVVNRALQNCKPNIFMPDPSMRAVGAGHTVLGETAPDVLNHITPYWPAALYHRKALAGYGRARESRPSSLPCRPPCSTRW